MRTTSAFGENCLSTILPLPRTGFIVQTTAEIRNHNAS
jgi:hypothetical protein